MSIRHLCRRGALRSLGLLAMMLAPACTFIQQLAPEPAQLYQLTAPRDFAGQLPPLTLRDPILVERPIATAALDTPRIALSSEPYRLEYFADVNWVDNAPAMFQAILVQAMENSSRLIPLGREPSGLRARYALRSELRSFHAEYPGTLEEAPMVRVQLSMKLVDFEAREIVDVETFEAAVPALSPVFADVIRAYDQAVEQVAVATVAWTLTMIAARSGG